MPLKNTTKNIILVYNTRFCKNTLTRAIGLMFSRKLYDKALVFVFKTEKFIPLHMFFVFYPIDVLFLNNNKEIVELRENIKPFSIILPRKKAKYIIELPDNLIKKTKTAVGDRISF